jgi:hypothetical protein
MCLHCGASPVQHVPCTVGCLQCSMCLHCGACPVQHATCSLTRSPRQPRPGFPPAAAWPCPMARKPPPLPPRAAGWLAAQHAGRRGGGAAQRGGLPGHGPHRAGASRCGGGGGGQAGGCGSCPAASGERVAAAPQLQVQGRHGQRSDAARQQPMHLVSPDLTSRHPVCSAHLAPPAPLGLFRLPQGMEAWLHCSVCLALAAAVTFSGQLPQRLNALLPSIMAVSGASASGAAERRRPPPRPPRLARACLPCHSPAAAPETFHAHSPACHAPHRRPPPPLRRPTPAGPEEGALRAAAAPGGGCPGGAAGLLPHPPAMPQ